MMRMFYRVVGAAVMGAALLLAGCRNETPVDPNQERESELNAMRAQVEEADSIADFYLSDTQILDDLDLRLSDFGTPGKPGDAITPVRWGRHIFWGQIGRSTELESQGDSVTIVTVTRTVPAELRIGINVGGDPGTGIDSVIKKQFVMRVQRKVRFVRVGHSSSPGGNWKPQAIAMVLGKTVPNGVNTFAITGMEISGGVDTAITNPLEMWFRYGRGSQSGIPRFFVGDSISVRVTVESRNDSAETVVLRHGFSGALAERRRMTMRLVSTAATAGQYVRTYERVFLAAPLPRTTLSARLNATVDALSYGSLHDDRVSVSNEFWGVPYIVSSY